mgnify:CR=1 FL=1
MGIPSYFSHIVKKYKKTIKSLESVEEHFDNLFMDCNSIIYDALRKLESFDNVEYDLIMATITKIEDYIQEIKPSNTIFIAFDGIAPFAKMNQQKTRRYKSAFQSSLEFLGTSQSKWSTTNITPGTKFMNALSETITKHFYQQEKKYGARKIITSCSDEVGEGEHKLFSYIRKNELENETIALYGLDADLIMLSIFNIHYVKNIYIFREAPEFYIETEEDFLVLDVDVLCNAIHSEMDCKYKNKKRIYDYVFMCFLLGNDFLPHFPALNIRTHGIPVLLDLYAEIIGCFENRFFIVDGKICWKYFQMFIAKLAKSEYQYILEEYNVRKKHDFKKWSYETEKDREYAFNSLPIIYRGEENYICPSSKFWEQRYYSSLFCEHNEPDFKQKLCVNYLQTLQWCFEYYSGECRDWRFTYEYHYPPLLSDLVQYIPDFNTNFIVEERKPFSNNLQLLYVLPSCHYHLLPNRVYYYLLENQPNFFKEKHDFIWAFCRYFWECHVKFEHISTHELELIDGFVKNI